MSPNELIIESANDYRMQKKSINVNLYFYKLIEKRLFIFTINKKLYFIFEVNIYNFFAFNLFFHF